MLFYQYSVLMDVRIDSDRGDRSGNSSKTMLPSWQPSASLRWHSRVSWGRLRTFLFPEMLLELSRGCWAGSSCGTWLVCIHGVIPWEYRRWRGPAALFQGYSWDILGAFWHSPLPPYTKNPMCINYLTLMSSNCPVFPGMPTMDTHGFSIFPG